MNEFTKNPVNGFTNNPGYPAFNKAWESKNTEIDQQIIDCCAGASENKPGVFDEIGTKLSSWWDKQNLDDTTKAEWQKFKSDTKLFKAKVDNRVQHLIQNGKITWAKQQKAAGTP